VVDGVRAANLDLKVADARLREARALRRVAAGGLFPELDAAASYARTERSDSSGDSPQVPGEVVGGRSVRSQGSSDFFRASLDALWEIDLFGGIRRGVEAADADAEAAEEERRGVLVRLIGDVAATYVELRGLQAEIATTRRNLETQRETQSLTEARTGAGLASDLDLERAKALVESTAADLPVLEASLRAAVLRLGVLLGGEPAALVSELAAESAIPSAPESVALGVPVDLLRRRPDVRAAERELAAATARIGAAEADLYPRLTLTGTVGFRSEDAADLFTADAFSSSFGPSLQWPIFQAGRLVAAVDVQEARQEQALARYELAVRRALEEVESAYARHAQQRERGRRLGRSVEASRSAADLARRLHASGLVDFLEVLDAERTLFAAERQLARSAATASADLVALYVALGGGWTR
jgi:outer membrane protein, multidrug efflux system